MGFDDPSTIHERDNSAAIIPRKLVPDLQAQSRRYPVPPGLARYVPHSRWSHTFDTFV